MVYPRHAATQMHQVAGEDGGHAEVMVGGEAVPVADGGGATGFVLFIIVAASVGAGAWFWRKREYRYSHRPLAQDDDDEMQALRSESGGQEASWRRGHTVASGL